MSFFGLNIAGSALDAYQQAANTTSNNIANVNTPGASRQIVNLSASTPIVGSTGYSTWYGPGTQGSGVTVDSITRIHQDSYDGLFRGASSAQNYYTVEQQQLQAIQAQFAEPNNGINAAFTSLQTAISQLASTPNGTSQRQGVISAAQGFVGALNTVGNAIQSSEATVVSQATGVVAQANALIDKIAALNGQIRASTAIGDNPNTYKDQRDQYVDQLSGLLATQTSVQANGSTLVTVGGRALVNDTQAYHLAAPVVGTDPSGNPTLVVGFVNDPNPSNPVPVQLGSGQLAGYLDVYNNKLSVYATKLNAFANATANEINRVTTAGYDQNGNPGASLLQPIVNSQAVSATNIAVGITDPAQVPAALASTAAGSLVVGLNAANNTVNTAAALLGSATLAHPGAALPTTTGTLTVTVDGVAQAFNYDFGAGGNAASVDSFITNFNSAQLGVSASYDTVAQKLVFARDPNNVSLAHRAQQTALGTPTSPTFTIGDSNALVGGSTGTPTGSLLEIVGAAGIDNVSQNSSNAFGAGDNAGANALLKLFSANLGVPALQTTSPTAIVAGGSTTIAPPVANPQAFAAIGVGQLLTIDAGTPNQENVVVTAVNRNTGTITFTASQTHAANFSITTGQSQTLGSYYGALVGQLGLDTQTALTGTSSQTTLAANIDQVRQGIDGINIDEETQNLIKYQNAYSAAAKTLNVMEQLLTTALGLIPGG
ncbi:MAG: putative flagellar hook-associated protein FlgK [Candidatus Eremiobacteraeota bacterium]|jgi:flagellar hook-associated protein 1 FlgK|nr:putative flagellar hook-associated protein FlgK [Candidatus Eremiobacteraeota bacterium]